MSTYKDAGVDIDKANALVSDIKQIAQRTQRPGVLAGIGGFGALFEIPSHYQQPVLVSGTDGVGTKLKLALALNQHEHIGVDLVAMCANDIICCGAEPLFFLDYYATGQLNTAQAQTVIRSIGQGCELAGCALIGGETAEMPGMYMGDDYDLAGFCVGAVEKEAILDGSKIRPGDQLIALGSSGPHANGFSLIRHIIDKHNIELDTVIDARTLADHLLTPTKIYVNAIQALKESTPIHGLAHITGGGLVENIPRVLPNHTQAMLNYTQADWPTLFRWLQSTGHVSFEEMVKSFNVGVGMVVIVPPKHTEAALAQLTAQGERAWVIGEIHEHDETGARVIFA